MGTILRKTCTNQNRGSQMIEEMDKYSELWYQQTQIEEKLLRKLCDLFGIKEKDINIDFGSGYDEEGDKQLHEFQITINKGLDDGDITELNKRALSVGFEFYSVWPGEKESLKLYFKEVSKNVA